MDCCRFTQTALPKQYIWPIGQLSLSPMLKWMRLSNKTCSMWFMNGWQASQWLKHEVVVVHSISLWNYQYMYLYLLPVHVLIFVGFKSMSLWFSKMYSTFRGRNTLDMDLFFNVVCRWYFYIKELLFPLKSDNALQNKLIRTKHETTEIKRNKFKIFPLKLVPVTLLITWGD